MTTAFKITTADQVIIRFRFYNEAPVTVESFTKALPFTETFFHARTSGQEIWTDKAPALEIIQENASVFTEIGEVVLGPTKPKRVRTAGFMGIYYGEGKGLDACNIFAKVFDEDLSLLQKLGNKIWMHGTENLRFEILI